MKQPLQELLHPEWNELIVIDIGEPIVFDDLIVSDLEWNNVIDSLSFDSKKDLAIIVGGALLGVVVAKFFGM